MKVVVVMPAYNAEKTLRRTYKDIPKHCVDEIILVDDKSQDKTAKVANELGLKLILHSQNLGYGANQKTCYREALKEGANIIVMLHPDYQYDPTLLPSIIAPIRRGECECVLGSRIIGQGALKGGMPLYKYIGNRILTLLENLTLNQKLSEYHTGYRAFTDTLLKRVPFEENSSDFVFDTEIIIQIIAANFRIKEIPIPTRYFAEASSIDFFRALLYGLKIVIRLVEYIVWKATTVQLFRIKTREIT